MWKQISKNKRNSVFVFLALSFLLLLIGALVGFVLSEGTIAGAVVGAIITVLIHWADVCVRNKKSLSISVGKNIQKCTKDDNQKLYNIVEEMSIAAGLSVVPDIYIMDTSEPNAFACGFSPEKSCVCVTTGLLELCNRDEVQGVIAHEIAHIVNRDTTYLLHATIVLEGICTLAEGYCRAGRRSSSQGGSVIIVLLILITPLIANLLYFLLSRKREFLADACAAQYTRYPVGLASALKKISNPFLKKTKRGLNDKKETSQFKSNPYLKVSCITPVVSPSLRLFSTHPSTDDRIKILMSMTDGADYASYNKAYLSVTKSAGVIHQSDVAACKKTPIRIGEPMVGLVGLTGGELTPEIKKMELDERIERRREVEDMMWKYERYSFINCPCKTRLKLPPTFKNKEVICPHCKTKHIIN